VVSDAALRWIGGGFWIVVVLWYAYSEHKRAKEEWDDLAARYAAPSAPPGPSFLAQRVWLDNVALEHAVRVIPSPTGLYLTSRLKRGRPVFVPWSEVVEVRTGLWIGPFHPAMTIRLAGRPYRAILLGPRGARAVKASRPEAQVARLTPAV